MIGFGQKISSNGNIVHFPPTVSVPGENFHTCNHIRLYFQFGPNKYKETITGIDFKWTIQDAFGDPLHSGNTKWGITIKSNEEWRNGKYIYWETCDFFGGQKIYNKLKPLVNNAKVVVVIKRIAFKDGKVLKF